MNALWGYLYSTDFDRWLSEIGVWLILATMAVAFVALWLEIRLPLGYYWGLPDYLIKSFLRGIRLLKPVPVWGKCYLRGDRKAMPLVACDLLDVQTQKVLRRTYTNHKGEFGFALVPGNYLLRAVKTRYQTPSLLDPENVRVYEVAESFVASVAVINREVVPVVDLPLEPIIQMAELTTYQAAVHYGRMLLFQLGNVFLGLNSLLAIIGWLVTREIFYGLILAVCLVLLFIKLYILETIRVAIVKENA